MTQGMDLQPGKLDCNYWYKPLNFQKLQNEASGQFLKLKNIFFNFKSCHDYGIPCIMQNYI